MKDTGLVKGRGFAGRETNGHKDTGSEWLAQAAQKSLGFGEMIPKGRV